MCSVQSVTGMCEELSQVEIYPAVQTPAEKLEITQGVYPGKPIKLKDDKVNSEQKKHAIDISPSFVSPLTPELFLNCFREIQSARLLPFASCLVWVPDARGKAVLDTSLSELQLNFELLQWGQPNCLG